MKKSIKFEFSYYYYKGLPRGFQYGPENSAVFLGNGGKKVEFVL